jgi:hypothetical protein
MADEGGSVVSESRRPVQPRRDLRPVIITAVAGVVVGIVVIFLVARLTHDGQVTRAEPAPPAPQPTAVAPAQPAPPVVQAPPAPPPRPQPAMIDVEIRVSPATATVSIDDKVVDGNPFSKQYPADTETHHVRAAAPGYVAKSVSVAFNANVTLDVSLERLPPPPPPPAPVAAPARPAQRQRPAEPVRKAEPPRPAEPAVQPPPQPPAQPPAQPPELVKPPGDIGPNPTKPRRTIDPSNPYDNHGGGQ